VCFDPDSHPPITPIAGGALDGSLVTLQAADGNRFAAFRARAAEPTGAGMLVLPDVRGLFTYYEELALRFAEHGIDSIAIDYFGRTAGVGQRDAAFEYMPHVSQTTWAGLSADIGAGVDALRADPSRVRSVFTVGFCFGGRASFLAGTLGLGLAGDIGFYGWPVGSSRNDTPAPATVADGMEAPILGLFGGADQGIPDSAVSEFRSALEAAGVDHELITYPGAPHSFFDRKAAEFTDASDDAWSRVLAFVRTQTTPAE
jgi:carboxymethylenebutenolidase